MNFKQDGRLAPAYFLHNYKYIYQLLQAVKNETTVLNLVFKGLLQTSFPPLISILYAKEGYHDFPLKIFCPIVPKNFEGEPFSVSKKFGYRKILCIRGVYHEFLLKIYCLTVPKNYLGELFLVSEKLWDRNFSYIREGWYHDFPS